MKTKIRRGFFETNSSSSHNICIALTLDLKIPPTLFFHFSDFPMFYGPINDMMEKASFLYTGLYLYNYDLFFQKVIPALKKLKIRVLYERYEQLTEYPDISMTSYGKFFDVVTNDEFLLRHFLFSELSFITGGYDGSDCKYYKNLKYEFNEYYAGGIG